MVEELERISRILELAIRLENLCEGFDETNKSAVLTSRVKILLELNKKDFVTPNALKNNVGLAKSNIAILCNSLVEEGFVDKTRDKIDTREILYSLTDSGKKFVEQYLKQAKKNFEGQLAYKDNMEQIEAKANDLFELVK